MRRCGRAVDCEDDDGELRLPLPCAAGVLVAGLEPRVLVSFGAALVDWRVPVPLATALRVALLCGFFFLRLESSSSLVSAADSDASSPSWYSSEEPEPFSLDDGAFDPVHINVLTLGSYYEYLAKSLFTEAKGGATADFQEWDRSVGTGA